MKNRISIYILTILLLPTCQTIPSKPKEISISRATYENQLYGFWLAQCIANWTGLVTEMDKIGNVGAIKTGDFYTRENWGKADLPNIWSEDGSPSAISSTIDFVFKDKGDFWGADDDTDIEYMYQYLLHQHQTTKLTGEQISLGWLKHIKKEEENFLWVSNQKAFDLMEDGMLPPNTSHPSNNEHYEMIDAQLTTEIFGLFAPTRPDVALEIAHLPIRTTAQQNAAWISEFYVVMYALASDYENLTMKERIFKMAEQARKQLSNTSYSAKMYDSVFEMYQTGYTWEQARDSVYVKYQVRQEDGYDITSKNIYCNGCFAAGINFAASLVSLFYGEGDLKETIKIGALTGWDSDNPMATWGGLIGFMLGKEGIEKAFGRQFSNRFNIHRTRQHFPNEGIDRFEDMAATGLRIIDRVVVQEMGGTIETDGTWRIPVN